VIGVDDDDDDDDSTRQLRWAIAQSARARVRAKRISTPNRGMRLTHAHNAVTHHTEAFLCIACDAQVHSANAVRRFDCDCRCIVSCVFPRQHVDFVARLTASFCA